MDAWGGVVTVVLLKTVWGSFAGSSWEVSQLRKHTHPCVDKYPPYPRTSPTAFRRLIYVIFIILIYIVIYKNHFQDTPCGFQDIPWRGLQVPTACFKQFLFADLDLLGTSIQYIKRCVVQQIGILGDDAIATVDGRNPASIQQRMWSSKSADPPYPQFNVVSCLVCVMQDFGHSTFFVFHMFPPLNVKEGARGCTWVCSSTGAGFCPPTVWPKQSVCICLSTHITCTSTSSKHTDMQSCTCLL